MATKTSTTIRIDPKLKKEISKIAREHGLSLSQIASIALKAIADGEMHINIGVTKYPPGYIEELEKEAKKTYRLYKEGNIKGYTNSQEAIDAMIKEAQDYES